MWVKIAFIIGGDQLTTNCTREKVFTKKNVIPSYWPPHGFVCALPGERGYTIKSLQSICDPFITSDLSPAQGEPPTFHVHGTKCIISTYLMGVGCTFVLVAA